MYIAQQQIDPALISRMKSGSQEAFRSVYLAYFDPLLAFVSKLLGSVKDSEDIVQDVFSKLWETRDRIDPERNIKSYLYVISRNAALKHMQKSYVLGQQEPMSFSWQEDGLSADDEIIAKETALLIECAIQNMPARRREVFQLYRDGFSYEQIAEKLGLTQHNVRKYVMRGRRTIEELLSLLIFFLIT